MQKQKRYHFSYNVRVNMLINEGFLTNDSLSIAKALDCISFDDLRKLSRVIMRISNGYFTEPNLNKTLK